MEIQTETPQNQQDKSNKGLMIALVALLVLLLGASGYLGYEFVGNSKTIKEQKEKIVVVTKERDAALEELEELKKQFEDLKVQNTDLMAQRDDALKRIADLEAKLRSAYASGGGGGGGGTPRGKVKQELEKLRKEYNEMLAQVDKLRAENASLKDSKYRTEQELSKTKQQYEQLAATCKTLQEKVDLASILKVAEIKSFASEVKKNGKEKLSDKASKANKVECCFKILENLVAEPGDKEVFLVVKNPSGKVLAEGGGTFEYLGSQMGYSAKKMIYYSNKNVDLCMEFSPKSKLDKGTYKCEIYIDGFMLGTSTFNLK